MISVLHFLFRPSVFALRSTHIIIRCSLILFTGVMPAKPGSCGLPYYGIEFAVLDPVVRITDTCIAPSDTIPLSLCAPDCSFIKVTQCCFLHTRADVNAKATT